jgi:hypothetical protein
VEVYLHALLTKTLDGGEQPLDRRSCGPENWSALGDGEKILPARSETLIIEPIAKLCVDSV